MQALRKVHSAMKIEFRNITNSEDKMKEVPDWTLAAFPKSLIGKTKWKGPKLDP